MFSHITNVGAVGLGTSGSRNTTGATVITVHQTDDPSNPTSFSDSEGNTWTLAATVLHPTSGHRHRAYYCINPVTSASHTWTTSGGNASVAQLVMTAFSSEFGVVFEDAGTNTSTGTSFNTGASDCRGGSLSMTCATSFAGGALSSVSARYSTGAGTGAGTSIRTAYYVSAAVAGQEACTYTFLSGTSDRAGSTMTFREDVPVWFLGNAWRNTGTGNTNTINTVGAKALVAYTATSTAPTDTQGNTWTSWQSGSTGGTFNTWYVLNPSTSATHTFTGGGSGRLSVVPIAADGNLLIGNTDLDTVTGTSLSSGPVTPNDQYSIAFLNRSSPASSAGTITLPAGWHNHASDGIATQLTRAQNTTATYSATTTNTTSVAQTMTIGVIYLETQVITPTGIASGEAFGSHTVTSEIVISPTGIPSGEAFGSHTVVSDQTITPTGIPSGEAFGTALVFADALILPTGIPSGEAFGSHTVFTDATVTPTGIPSGEAFGSHTVIADAVIRPTGIASGEAFGSHIVLNQSDVVILPTGIPSGEAFSIPNVAIDAIVTPTGIPSGEAFGTAVVTRVGVITPTGIPSGEAFGTAQVLQTVDIYPIVQISGQFAQLQLFHRLVARDGDPYAVQSYVDQAIATVTLTEVADADQAALTNSTGGSYDGTLAAVSGTGDDATINDNFTDLHTLVHAIRQALIDNDIIKGSA